MRHRMRAIRQGSLQALLVILTLLNACTYWRPTQVEPAELVEHKRPEEIRVTTRQGLEAVLTHPVISGDSLIGYGGGLTERKGPVRRIAVPLWEVEHLSLRDIDPAQSLGMTVVVGLAALGAVMATYIIGCSGGSCD